MDDYGMGLPAAQPPQPPRAPRQRNMRRWLVIGGATAALLVALGVGVGVGASALTAHANGLSTLQTTLASLNSNKTNGGPHGATNGGPNGRPGFGPGRGGLTVSSVSGQTITAKRPDGASVTVKVTANTKYTRAGKTVSLSAITSGEAINVRGTRNSDGSITATQVEIVLPHLGGQVTAISGSTITVRDRDGGTATIHTSSSTTVQRAGQSSSLSAIAVGAQINAEGTKNSDGSLNAEAITIILPRAGGQVKSVSGSTITVTDPRGASTTTINVTASTKYVTVTFGSNGPTQSASSLSAVKAGVFIHAEGTKNSDGSLTAEVVTIMPTPPSGMPGPGGLGDHDGPRYGAPPATTTSN